MVKAKRLSNWITSLSCVRNETRTHTAERPLPPQSSVSTNSTTRTSINLCLRFDKKIRAKNGTRTRDPNLGKVVLYQLSYFRNSNLFNKDWCISLFSLSEKRDSNPRPQPWQGCALPTELFSQLRCKGRHYFLIGKCFVHFFSKFFYPQSTKINQTNINQPFKNI